MRFFDTRLQLQSPVIIFDGLGGFMTTFERPGEIKIVFGGLRRLCNRAAEAVGGFRVQALVLGDQAEQVENDRMMGEVSKILR